MLKLNASYSKKVPADGEYTSHSYHASIEVELPDGLSSEQLNGKIHETFEMVRNSEETELHGKPLAGKGVIPLQTPRKRRDRPVTLPARNRSITCSLWRAAAGSPPPKSQHRTMSRTFRC